MLIKHYKKYNQGIVKDTFFCYNFISIVGEDMEKSEKKISKKSIIFIIISMLLVVAAGTFAWLSYRTQDTAMVLTIGDVKGLTVTLTPYQINATLSPVSDYTDGEVVNVTADNKSLTSADTFSLFYNINTIDTELRDQGFMYTITKSTDNGTSYSKVKEDNFSSASSGSKLDIYQENVPLNTKYLYKVYIWIDSSAGNQANMQNKSFVAELNASISLSPYNVMRNNAVMDNISSTYVTNSNGVQFDDISSDMNGKGIYIRSGTENNQYPIYYYRGEVNDNNVLFANFCWKIVRTTDTGGTKLIYNGEPTGTNHDKCENTTGTATQLSATSKFNASSTSPADVGYMYGTRYTYSSKTMTSISDTYMYGTGYDETNHRLVSTDAMNFAGTAWSSNYNKLNNNHYTCFNTSGECSPVYYIYYTTSSTAYYVQVPAGKTISGMLDEMLTNSSNTTSSTIKTAIDNWYSTNMTSYTSKLEDTPWCNDRSIYQLNGWDPNGGDTTKYLYFGGYGRAHSTYIPNLSCSKNDAFTKDDVAIGNGKLTYPVGLLTSDEVMLAGGNVVTDNSIYYLYTNRSYWSGAPDYYINDSAIEFRVGSSGGLNANFVFNTYGVRPAVSLKPGIRFARGDGTADTPYVVE